MSSRPQHRHRQRTRSHTGFEDPLARPDVGRDQDGPEVLWVDDLRARGILSTMSLSVGRSTRIFPPGRSGDGATFLSSDDVVVGNDPRVGVEVAACTSVKR